MDTTRNKYFASFTDAKLETTSMPNDLCNVLQGLTDAQKSDIRDMGFQSIESFSISRIPMGLGSWLLDNYDHKRNELDLGSHKIKITPSKVHEVFGVPMGGILIYEKRYARKEDVIRKEWKKQPFRYPAITFVKNVIEILKLNTKGGTLFKLNFLVVFNSVIGGTTKSGTVSQRFLSSIRNEDDIRNMDWCSYIITCLKRTKEEWNGKEPYNGPLTFLAVLYAHEQQLRRNPEKAITPAILYVNTGFLVDLEGSMHIDIQVKLETQTNGGQIVVDQNISLQQDEVQPQTDECQTAMDHNVNVPQDEEHEDQFQTSNPESALNLKLPIGPLYAQPLSGLSANPVNCNRLELPKDKKVENGESGIVCVQGYKVKQSVANIFEAILKKHGDIAADCVLKTDSMRSPILETVCEIVKRIQANDAIERSEDIKSQLSDAKAVNIDVSWIEAHLEAREMYTLLMTMKADNLSARKVALDNLRKRRAELAAAEERSNEAKRRVEVLHLVGKILTDSFFQLKAKTDSSVTGPLDLAR